MGMPTDATLSIAGTRETLELGRILRILPGRRVAAEATLAGRRVFVKFWATPKGALEDELRAIVRVRDCGLSTARVLRHGVGRTSLFEGRVDILVQEWIEGRDLGSLVRSGDPSVPALLEEWLALLGRLAASGLVHGDPHLANFLVVDDRIYLVDAASIKAVPAALRELEVKRGLLDALAQLDPDLDGLLPRLVDRFRAAYDAPSLGLSKLHSALMGVRQKRRTRYFKKLLRPCSLCEVVRRDEFRAVLSTVVDRRLALEAIQEFEAQPLGEDDLVGSSSSVAARRSPLGSGWIIHRFISEATLWSGFKRSDAENAWLWTHWLLLHDMPVAPPIAVAHLRPRDGRRIAAFIADEVGESELASAWNAFDVDARASLLANVHETLRRLAAIGIGAPTRKLRLAVVDGRCRIKSTHLLGVAGQRPNSNVASVPSDLVDQVDWPPDMAAAFKDRFGPNP